MLRIKQLMVLASIIVLGCSVAQAQEIVLPVVGKTYLVKPDTRRCAAPLCGGYFLTAVNQFTIQLENDNQAYETSLLKPAEIYVSSIKFSNMRLTTGEIQEIKSTIPSQRTALIQGNLVSTIGIVQTKVLVPSAVWLGANNVPAYGPYLHVSPTGIVCITSPCPSYLAKVINTTAATKFDQLNFEKAGLDKEQEVLAWQELSTKGLVTTGVKYDIASIGVVRPGVGVYATKVFFSFPNR